MLASSDLTVSTKEGFPSSGFSHSHESSSSFTKPSSSSQDHIRQSKVKAVELPSSKSSQLSDNVSLAEKQRTTHQALESKEKLEARQYPLSVSYSVPFAQEIRASSTKLDDQVEVTTNDIPSQLESVRNLSKSPQTQPKASVSHDLILSEKNQVFGLDAPVSIFTTFLTNETLLLIVA